MVESLAVSAMVVVECQVVVVVHVVETDVWTACSPWVCAPASWYEARIVESDTCPE